MITTSDIGDIIYSKCASLGIQRYHQDTFPSEEIEGERVVIIVKDQTDGMLWEKCFVEVNVCVPDHQRLQDRRRLAELEREVKELFREEVAGSFDNTTYRYKRNSFGTHSDASLRIHFINTRLLFESQKVII